MDWSRALSDSRPGSRGAFDFGSREGEVADGGAIVIVVFVSAVTFLQTFTVLMIRYKQ